MALILPKQSLVLNAYAVLVSETPGNAALTEHLAYIDANGNAKYIEALESVFELVSTKDLATRMLANLGLTTAWPTAQADAEVFLASYTNRVEGMLALADKLYNYAGSEAELIAASTAYKAEIAGSYSYSSNPANVAGKEISPNPDVGPITNTFNLSVGLDVLTGTSSDDAFMARVVQNVNGEQTNQLATGDQLHGGSGIDTLFATVQMAAALNNTSSQAITPETISIEKAYFTALTVDNATSAKSLGLTPIDASEYTVINAKRMLGLNEVGSVDSDASLLIENLTTLTNTGAYADRRNTEAVRVRMDHSGNDAAADAESNLVVLFDNDYLLAGKTTSDTAYYFLEDREGAAANAAKPLNHINTDGLVFSVNGVNKVISLTSEQMTTFQANDGTWAGYTALMKAALATAALTDASLAGLTLELSTTVFRTLGLDGTTLPVPAPAIVLSSATDVIESLGFHNQSDAVGQYDVFAVISNEAQATQNLPVTVNIDLYKVGRGSDGGALIVGGMATDYNNTLGYSTSAIKEGVEKFNLIVDGDDTQDSNLSTVRSTNNTLQTVVVTNKAGSTADLYIGNHNTANVDSNDVLAMKDVKTYDSSAFANDVRLSAGLTGEMDAKYGLGDLAVTYTFGVGNDSLGLDVAENESEQIDLHVAMGEGNDTVTMTVDGDAVDAVTESLAIDAGNGNNTISVTIADGAEDDHAGYDINGVALATTDLLKNLNITSGSGVDKVSITGVGNFDIFTGAGSDMVYIKAGGSVGANHLWTADGASAAVTAAGVAATAALTGDQTAATNATTAVVNAAAATGGTEPADLAAYQAAAAAAAAAPSNAALAATAAAALASLDVANQALALTETAALATVAADQVAIAAEAAQAAYVAVAVPEFENGIALYHAKLTIRYAGFESTVDINTGTDFIAEQQDINKAVIAAIAANPELARLLSAAIGTLDQDLIVRALIDGNHQFEMAIFQPELIATGTAVGTQVMVGSSDVTGLQAALVHTGRAINSADVVDTVGDGAVVTAADVAGFFTDAASATLNLAGVLGPFTGGAAGEGVNGTYQYYAVDLAGAEGTGLNNSVINMSSGANDLTVLSSNDASANTLVFNAAWGKVSVVNFFTNDETVGNEGAATPAVPGDVMTQGLHQLDFTAFLTNTVSSSGSVLSELPIAITVANSLQVIGAANSFTANNIVFADIDSLELATTTATNLSFAGLSAAQVQAALNSVGGFGAGIQFEAVGTVPNTVVQTTRTSLLFVENVDTQATNATEPTATGMSFEELIAGVGNTSYANYGDYKVYQVTYADTAVDAVVAGTDAGFTVTLLGQVDFGNSLNLTTLMANESATLVGGAAA